MFKLQSKSEQLLHGSILFVLFLSWNFICQFVIFSEPVSWWKWGVQIAESTGGLINLTWQLNSVALIAFLVYCRVFLWRSRLLYGLEARQFVVATFVATLLFTLQSSLQIGLAYGSGNPPEFHPIWRGESLRGAGIWLSQFLGNALFEEIVYRGFFFLLILRVVSGGEIEKRSTHFYFALLISQVLFAAIHLPVDLKNNSLFLLGPQFAIGVILGIIAWRAKNLWLTIFVHTLINGPPGIFVERFSGGAIAGISSLIIAILLLLFHPSFLWPSKES